MDAKAVINHGLAKVTSSRIQNISPPNSPLERHCAQNYPQWRDSELMKRRWVFARAFKLLDENPGVTPADGYEKVYDLPSDCLRPIRDKYSTWIVAGKHIHAQGPVTLEYVRRVPENEFDPLFVDALAARICLECVEFITQSNTKGANAEAMYKEAIKQAGVANALVIGTEDAKHADVMDDWELARAGYV